MKSALSKTLLLVFSITSISAQAYLVPGNGGGHPSPQPNPPQYCRCDWGHSYPCDDHSHDGHYNSNQPGHGPHEPPPNDNVGQNPGYGPGYPGYPGYPGHGPNRPPRPPRPHEPPYPYPTDPSPYDPNPGYPNYPNDPGYGYNDVKRIYVNRSVRNERLPLRELAGLDSRYRGWEIVSVRAQTRPNSSSTTIAQLLVDGRIVADQRNPGYQISLYPAQRIVLGQTAQSVQLAISGSTIIDVIEIEITNNGSGGYDPGYGSEQIDLNIFRTVYGTDRVDLTSYIDMYRYRGYRIESIEITARADYNVATAELMVNSFTQGSVQFSSSYAQSQILFLNQRPVLGQGADSLVLRTRGNMTIERVLIRLSR